MSELNALGMNVVLHYDEAFTRDLGNGCTRRIHVHSGNLMLVEFIFKKGAIGALHRHPHEQTGYVLHGSFEFELDGKKCLLNKGDSYYVPSNGLHGVVALEDSSILDAFTPQRDDFIADYTK